MDFEDPRAREVFFQLHSGLPREGPGSRASTRRALSLVQPLPPQPRVLDIGCGPGAQTIDLAEALPTAHIVAVDNHPLFVEAVRTRAARHRLADRVQAHVADMTALPFAPGSFDLLWSEGAAYLMGVERALAAWRPLLADGGRIGFSEAVWRTSEPPPEVRRYWSAGYPEMLDVCDNMGRLENAGFQCVGWFVLPDSDWWEYYAPIEERLAAVSTRYADDPVAGEVLAETRREVEMYRRFSSCYGYAFLVGRRGDPRPE